MDLHDLGPGSQMPEDKLDLGLTSEDHGLLGQDMDIEAQGESSHVVRSPPTAGIAGDEKPAEANSAIKTEPTARQSHMVIVPSYSSWFDMTRIHEIERECLPEFFTGKNGGKTPQTYVKFRNFIVNTYRLEPTEYLTVTACRRNLLGDSGTIMRVHNFLEKWGLINYQVDIEARPVNVEPPFTGHWQVRYDMPRGMFPFQVYHGMEDPNLQPRGPASSNGPHSGPGGPGGPDGAGGSPNRPPGQSSQNDLHQKSWKFEDKEWSRDDVLKLLDAVEKYPHSWDTIAKVVGRSKSDAITKFVQQNTEDRFCENLGPLKYNSSHIPFSRAENPVLSVLSFLAGLADPQEVKIAIEAIRAKTGKEEVDPLPISLALAATRSHKMDNDTGRAIASKYTDLVAREMEVIKMRMSKFHRMEEAIETERREMDYERELLFLDRLNHRRALEDRARTIDEAAGALDAGDSTKARELSAKLRSSLDNPESLIYESSGQEADAKPYSLIAKETFKTWHM